MKKQRHGKHKKGDFSDDDIEEEISKPANKLTNRQ